MRIFRVSVTMSSVMQKYFSVSCLALALTFLLSGCHHKEDMQTHLMKVDYQDRHPIKVHNYLADIRFTVKNNSQGLTEKQKRRFEGFIEKYKKDGNGPLQVASPRDGDNEMSVYKAVGDIRKQLTAANIAPGAVVYKSYSLSDLKSYKNTGHIERGQILIAYRHYVAQSPDCGDWSDNLGENSQNLNYRNFGCSQQYNLAAMIANPRDLVQHRGLSPRSSSRRDTIWDKYVKGDSTISKRSSEERGTVSDVAKQ